MNPLCVYGHFGAGDCHSLIAPLNVHVGRSLPSGDSGEKMPGKSMPCFAPALNRNGLSNEVPLNVTVVWGFSAASILPQVPISSASFFTSTKLTFTAAVDRFDSSTDMSF